MMDLLHNKTFSIILFFSGFLILKSSGGMNSVSLYSLNYAAGNQATSMQQTVIPKVLVCDFINQSFYDSRVLGAMVSTIIRTEIDRSENYKIIEDSIQSSYIMNTVEIDDYKSYFSSHKDTEGIPDYIILGYITEFGLQTKSFHLSSNIYNVDAGEGGGGSYSRGKGTARIVADIRIYELKSGDKIFSTTIEGIQSSKNDIFGFELMGYSPIDLRASIQTGVIGFDETLAGKACRNLAVNLLSRLKDEEL